MRAKTANIVLTMAMNAAKKTRSTPRQWSAKSTPSGARGTSPLGRLGLELRGLVEAAPDQEADQHDERR